MEQNVYDMKTAELQTPQFKHNPSLQDLENQLSAERKKLLECYGSEEERYKIISRIRMIRSSIEMMHGYIQHFMLN